MATERTLDAYTDSDRSDHEIAKARIAHVLASEHRGRYREVNGERVDNTISSAELAERCPVSASTVRDLIKEVRREYRLPIGNANGYFVADTPEQAREQIEKQLRQAETSRRTAGDIQAAAAQSGVLEVE